MGFFDEPTVEEVAQRHISEVMKLEESEAKRVIAAYKRIRHELRDRLDTLPRGSFSQQKAAAALAQVEGALAAMNESLLTEMNSSAENLAGSGVEDLFDELRRYDRKFLGAATPINVDAVAIASDTQNLLFNRYESSLSAYSSAMRARMAQALVDAEIAKMGWGEVVSGLSKTFLGEEWRLERIVRTELHNVYNQAKIKGMIEVRDQDMPDLMKTLFHPMDHRTGKDSKRLAQNNPIVPIDEPFKERSTGKLLTYMAPPNRPNDRAILIPYRKSWK